MSRRFPSFPLSLLIILFLVAPPLLAADKQLPRCSSSGTLSGMDVRVVLLNTGEVWEIATLTEGVSLKLEGGLTQKQAQGVPARFRLEIKKDADGKVTGFQGQTEMHEIVSSATGKMVDSWNHTLTIGSARLRNSPTNIKMASMCKYDPGRCSHPSRLGFNLADFNYKNDGNRILKELLGSGRLQAVGVSRAQDDQRVRVTVDVRPLERVLKQLDAAAGKLRKAQADGRCTL